MTGSQVRWSQPEPVEQEQSRARPELHVGPAVPVDRHVLHAVLAHRQVGLLVASG